MSHITVLGTGKIGREIIFELSINHTIVAIDNNNKKLDEIEKMTKINTIFADVTKINNIQKIIDETDLIINSLPGSIGYKIVEETINNGIDSVNISLFNKNPLKLNQKAKENNTITIVDAGIAPGLNNLILGHHYKLMEVKEYKCYVGGLPFQRNLPLQYKAPYSPIDVLVDYIQKSHYIKNGKKVTKDGLTEPEYIDIEPIGTLEAFNTVGLRTLMHTLDIPNMQEKTLRYPGHRDLMKNLKDLGFLNNTPIDIGGKIVKPLELTSRLLFPKWKLKAGEEEFTVMLIIIKGIQNGSSKKIKYTLFKKKQEKSNITSLAKTSGATCSALCELILQNKFNKKGVIPPEYIGFNKDCFNFIWDYLKKRDIKINKSVVGYRKI